MNHRIPRSQRDHVLVGVKATPSGWPSASPDPDSRARSPHNERDAGPPGIHKSQVSTLSGDCRTVAEEYFAVTDKVDALYQQARALPADALGPNMARLRREHHRHLGNGYCTRPPELDCAFENICETCTFFQTSIEFRPTLQAQHDDATAKQQTHRADLFNTLLQRVDHHEAS
jgi:hypothetical protein